MALFIGFAPHLYLMPSVQKNSTPVSKMAILWTGNHLFQRDAWRHGEISMDLVGNIAITDAVSNIAAALTGGNVGGIMQTVTQQLGLGLMLSTLLITVPPMAGMWFNGMMATYSGYNAMQGWGTGQPATPPGMNSQPQQANYNVQNRAEISDNPQSNSFQQPIWTTGGSQTGGSTTTDAIKLTNQPSKGNTPS